MPSPNFEIKISSWKNNIFWSGFFFLSAYRPILAENDLYDIQNGPPNVRLHFSSKNYHLEQLLINPKLSYLLDDNKRFDLFYQFEKKDNIIQNREVLEQHKLGISAVLNQNQKAAITAEFNYFSNNFKGNTNSPVAYQMMQGLQDGTNFTWSLIAQKKLTKFLDLNLNYFGRKTETSKTIHTGTVQLKAYF